MPSVSDPGYRLVVAAIEAGVRHGPRAVGGARGVALSLPTDRFCFEGFLPRKAGERGARLAALAAEARTMVFFEAPHRLVEMLADAASVLGGARPAAVCRELTKTYEEVRRGGLAELAEWAAGGVLGEITVVVGGAPNEKPPLAAAIDEVVTRQRRGSGRRRPWRPRRPRQTRPVRRLARLRPYGSLSEAAEVSRRPREALEVREVLRRPREVSRTVCRGSDRLTTVITPGLAAVA